MTAPPESADGGHMIPRVFFGAAAAIVVVTGVTVFATKSVGGVIARAQQSLTDNVGWLYVATMTGLLAFAIWLMLSRYGTVRLGRDDERPEFSTPAWFAMLFSAGMGIGLMFFSVAEPITHYASPMVGGTPSVDSARAAMGLTFFHWCLHPWAIYAVVAVALAYFSFRKGLPLSIRSLLHPWLGDRIAGGWGDLVDGLAIVATLFGVATSLGLGAMQVNAGLAHLMGVEISTTTQVVIIVVITAAATASVVSGLDRGVKLLSTWNVALAFGLMVFVFAVGPTGFLLDALVQNIGEYLQRLPHHSFWTAAYDRQPPRPAHEWLTGNTIFYWAWWIAWAPFVGMFIARISRGRTIRELVAGALLGPTFAGMLWLTVFGNTALYEELFVGGGIVDAVSADVSTAIYVLLARLPAATITSVVCTVCVVLFFVTSSDSASLVVDTIASGGATNPAIWQRVFWAGLEGAVAGALLLGGGLRALQTAALCSALPFCLVALWASGGLVRELRREPGRRPIV